MKKHEVVLFSWLLELLRQCERCLCNKGPKARVGVTLRVGNSSFTVYGVDAMNPVGPVFNISSPDTDAKRFSIAMLFTDAAQNPGTVDPNTPITVVSDNPTAWTVENIAPTPNGVNFDLVAQGSTGAANIAVDVDVDLGAGVTDLTVTGTAVLTATEVTGATATVTGPV